MDTLQTRISPKQAVARGFEEFESLFEGNRLKYVLLEGLFYDDTTDEWRVTIGFDTGRTKESGGPFAAAGLGGKTSEPIREFRTIYLRGDDGSFVRLDHE